MQIGGRDAPVLAPGGEGKSSPPGYAPTPMDEAEGDDLPWGAALIVLFGGLASTALGGFFALGRTFAIVYGFTLVAILLVIGISTAVVGRRTGDGWRSALARGWRRGIASAGSVLP